MRTESTHQCRYSYPDFNRSITAGTNDVFVIEIDDIHCRSVSDQHATYGDVSGRIHLPDGNGSIFGARHHRSVAETKVQDGFAVVQESVQDLSGLHVPDANGRVGRACHNDFLIVLQTENAAIVASENLSAFERFPVPDFDGIITEATDDLLVIVLQTVDTFGVLRTALNLLQLKISRPPVGLQLFDITGDLRVQTTVEFVPLGLLAVADQLPEEKLRPSATIGQPTPERVRQELPFDELLPQHAYRNGEHTG